MKNWMVLIPCALALSGCMAGTRYPGPEEAERRARLREEFRREAMLQMEREGAQVPR